MALVGYGLQFFFDEFIGADFLHFSFLNSGVKVLYYNKKMLESGVKKAFYSALFKALAMSSKGCENGGVLGSSKDFKALFNCI